MSIRKPGIENFFLLLLPTLFLLASCAGAPEVFDAGPDAVFVTLSTEAEIKAAYGYTYATNPFLPPPGLFTGGRNAFLVVRFVASVPVELDIAGADLMGRAGRLKTKLYGKEELRQFWETKTVDDGTQETDAKNQRRFSAIDRYGLRLHEPNALRKGSPYSLLILGPAEEDIGAAELTLRCYVNGEYMEKTFPVVFEGK